MFQLHNVSKAYSGITALRNINLELQPGETTILIGPSGCGKSTILRLMLGLISPDSGQVQFDGLPLQPEYIIPIRRRIGYVIQDGGLFPHFTASQNISIMANQLGWKIDKINARLRQLVELTGFPDDGLDRFPIELSGGQRQRIALMRALMLDPDVLLFDEPLGALDPMVRYSLQEDLKAIFKSLGKTTVLVTHDLAEAAYFSDKIVLMRDGGIVQEGQIKDMLANPADEFVADFFKAQRGSIIDN